MTGKLRRTGAPGAGLYDKALRPLLPYQPNMAI